jgi:DNA-binding transcriptional ArsR family regulator
MNAESADARLARIASAIAEPSRTRMLCCLLDGHARTATELSMVAGVSPSTASVHLARLTSARLVEVTAQGKHRYFALAGSGVAAAVESLLVISGEARKPFSPRTPTRLSAARTCYDHIAGALGVSLHDRLLERRWLEPARGRNRPYTVTAAGEKGFAAAGIDVAECRARRRRLAFACLDWSERRPHLGGSLGAALLGLALKRKWVIPDLDSRALSATRLGRRELGARFGLRETIAGPAFTSSRATVFAPSPPASSSPTGPSRAGGRSRG